MSKHYYLVLAVLKEMTDDASVKGISFICVCVIELAKDGWTETGC